MSARTDPPQLRPDQDSESVSTGQEISGTNSCEKIDVKLEMKSESLPAPVEVISPVKEGPKVKIEPEVTGRRERVFQCGTEVGLLIVCYKIMCS